MKKTHAIRLLESKGIEHRVTEYDASGEFHTGEEAASLVGAHAESVYKTLVVLNEGEPKAKPMMALIPVAAQLDLKALASAVGAKKLRMATQREAEKLTGMQVGGISALALQRPDFDVLLDEQAILLHRFHISAGARGMDVELAVEDFVALTDARYVNATG